MRGRFLVGLAVAVMIFSVAGNADAQVLSRVVFNGWTQARYEGNPPEIVNRMVFLIYTSFNPVAHPPDFIQQITVRAPNGQDFSLNPTKDWYINDQAFAKSFSAADFDGGRIPGGIYEATVVPISGTGIVERDTISNTFLPLPTISFPTDGQTGVSSRPTFQWTSVRGATFYRVVLWIHNTNGFSEPVYEYYIPSNTLQTDRTSIQVPRGVLKPNTTYRLQIQARADSNDLDARSQSSWVYFTTRNW
jgi:hypothetical protein